MSCRSRAVPSCRHVCHAVTCCVVSSRAVSCRHVCCCLCAGSGCVVSRRRRWGEFGRRLEWGRAQGGKARVVVVVGRGCWGGRSRVHCCRTPRRSRRGAHTCLAARAPAHPCSPKASPPPHPPPPASSHSPFCPLPVLDSKVPSLFVVNCQFPREKQNLMAAGDGPGARRVVSPKSTSERKRTLVHKGQARRQPKVNV